MFTFQRTNRFAKWLREINDPQDRARILMRLIRAQHGQLGDTRHLGSGIIEMRLHFGPGYRIYFAQERSCYLLLWGGTKNSQTRDISMARALWQNFQRNNS
ncbi:hypothetical protein PIGHUM_01124 [Pigmentiphaga humi]|uniref:Addiction module killer protein n=1 Tax=Pigmentiphaga humi TaxID=2478468 RepID=A0A3P4AYB7_9BURK|nr:type II toxin-antitoxin system RelE/ParE family toxin [Pigmentiphaga humi]VCU69064.1 hypothetical protein PIGHUM_01124 [Pigmentiphaga humi]